jgi:transcriptional regulator with XRE-family HTH domain
LAPPNYNRLEAGRHRPTADTLLRIAEAMGISLGRLVQG